MRHFIRCSFRCAIAGAALLLSLPLLANDSLTQNELLNIAGKQRMLSQQAAVLALRDDINEDEKRTQLSANLTRFSQSQNWLTSHAHNDTTRAALQYVNELFSAYQTQLLREHRDLKEVVALSERLLDGCEKVMKRFEADYGYKDPSAVNLMGRMRMLSQRQAKWYLVWNHQLPINHLADALNQSVQQSDIILSTLRDRVPNAEMKSEWTEMESLFGEQKRAIRSAYHAQFETKIFVDRSNQLLSMANHLTNQWERH